MWHDAVHEADVVMLRETLPQHNLVSGRIGRIAHVVRYDHFEVEFEDDEHKIVAKIPLKLEQVHVLRHETNIKDREFWKLIEAAKAQSGGDPKRIEPLLVE